MFTFRQAKFTEKDFTVIENRAVASWGELGESGLMSTLSPRIGDDDYEPAPMSRSLSGWSLNIGVDCWRVIDDGDSADGVAMSWSGRSHSRPPSPGGGQDRLSGLEGDEQPAGLVARTSRSAGRGGDIPTHGAAIACAADDHAVIDEVDLAIYVDRP